MKMKIIHTDKDENPALVLDAVEFLQKNAAINSAQSANDAIIDLSTGNPLPETAPTKTKNNQWIWGIVILLIIAIIATLIVYFKRKKEREQGLIN